jgi:hypothetical protein
METERLVELLESWETQIDGWPTKETPPSYKALAETYAADLRAELEELGAIDADELGENDSD